MHVHSILKACTSSGDSGGCVCVCVCVCVHACVRACVRVCVCVHACVRYLQRLALYPGIPQNGNLLTAVRYIVVPIVRVHMGSLDVLNRDKERERSKKLSFLPFLSVTVWVVVVVNPWLCRRFDTCISLQLKFHVWVLFRARRTSPSAVAFSHTA